MKTPRHTIERIIKEIDKAVLSQQEKNHLITPPDTPKCLSQINGYSTNLQQKLFTSAAVRSITGARG